MDSVESPQTILRSPDSPVGWNIINRLIRAMETHQVHDLTHPIKVGGPDQNDPGNCWLID
jgi:hypothetical protein